jgi:MOSC domain-containing protein YiiM
MYPSEHYSKWREELGNKPIFEQVGAFGENLSSSGISEFQICIGDRIKIGSTLLET